ncbi:hypothetical protein [Fervidibacter sacchari]
MGEEIWEVRFLPSRKTAGNGDWRVANGEWRTARMDLTNNQDGWLHVQSRLKPAIKVDGCKLRVVG